MPNRSRSDRANEINESQFGIWQGPNLGFTILGRRWTINQYS